MFLTNQFFLLAAEIQTNVDQYLITVGFSLWNKTPQFIQQSMRFLWFWFPVNLQNVLTFGHTHFIKCFNNSIKAQSIIALLLFTFSKCSKTSAMHPSNTNKKLLSLGTKTVNQFLILRWLIRQQSYMVAKFKSDNTIRVSTADIRKCLISNAKIQS